MNHARNPNRALLLTHPGTAAIAVVRLIGPKTGPFLQRFFNTTPRSGRPVHGILRDGGRILDDPVVVLIDPKRADVNLHGGTWVVRSVLELARQNGFEIISSTEFPLPDDSLEGSDPLLREVESHLPLARSELGLRLLLAQSHAWRELQLAFAHQPPDQQKTFINQCLDDRSLIHLLHPPAIAIIGAPNVGKSTLANQLFARQHSITADLPGTTRDWVGEIADIDGLPVLLIDTAGIRPTQDVLELASINQSHQQARSADLVMIVLHAAHPPDEQISQLLAQYPGALHIINKCDLPHSSSHSPGAPGEGWGEGSNNDTPLYTIATTGHGIAALRRCIAAYFHCDSLEIPRPRWWTDRQRQILLCALDNPRALSDL